MAASNLRPSSVYHTPVSPCTGCSDDISVWFNICIECIATAFEFLDSFRSIKVFTFNVNSGNGLIITDYGTMTEMWDDGNLFSIEDAGPFDPAEALAMFGNKG